MSTSCRPLSLFRSLVLFSLLGLAVLVLIGPVLAIVGVLLPFALIGLLAWGGYRLLARLRRRIWARKGEREIVRVAELNPEPPLEVVALETPAPAPAPRPRAWRTVGYVLAEMVCGAAVGASLAVLAAWQQDSSFEFVPIGAGIGAVVGFVVGGARPSQPHEAQPVTPAAQGRAA
jgi:hypothetical protein